VTYKETFEKNKFVVIRNILDPHVVKFLASYYWNMQQQTDGQFSRDWTSWNGKGDACADTVLYMLRSAIEAHTGLELLPTYSFVRSYRKGDRLGRHRDGPANEVSCAMCISKDVKWPLGFGDGDKEYTVHLEPGDGAIYRGFDLEHWRDRYDGENQVQVIVGYIIKGGEFDAHRFYGRGQPMYMPTSVRRAGPIRLTRGFLFKCREAYRKRRDAFLGRSRSR